VISDEEGCELVFKLLVLLMMLLDNEEYKHVERKHMERQWGSRREERETYYTILMELSL